MDRGILHTDGVERHTVDLSRNSIYYVPYTQLTNGFEVIEINTNMSCIVGCILTLISITPRINSRINGRINQGL